MWLFGCELLSCCAARLMGYRFFLKLKVVCARGDGKINTHFFFATEQFEDGMIKDRLENLKYTPVTQLVEEDLKFLRSICCPVGPKQKVVNLSSFDKEKIQGYAIVLKQIDGKNLTSFFLSAL